MANFAELISQIRFGLEQLSVRNAHHGFEDLCRHVARARVCSNILPATGPVGAGGDQGRDFETFRTYLKTTSIAESTFVGLVSDRPIAFACSLEQKKKILSKIKSDVKTITSSGSTVESVHFFSVADISVASRHKLQAWAAKTYQIHLEIYDGNAISELLADREIFWIAVKYLNIPSEIYPRSVADESEHWYSISFSKWQNRVPEAGSFSQFEEIKAAARHSLFENTYRQDLPFWIDLLETSFTTSPFHEVRRRAAYEVCVLSLRGLNTLEGHEERLRDYFSATSSLVSVSEIEDARNLVSYCAAAFTRGLVGLTASEISDWEQALTARINERLASAPLHPNVEAGLLGLKGWTYLTIDPRTPSGLDFDNAINCWLKLVEMVHHAPMFPLRRFARNVSELLELMLARDVNYEIPRAYFVLTEKLDKLLGKRDGGFTAAENCRMRAEILHDKGRIREAIDLLHRSKVDWYASETLSASLSTMLFLSMAYMELGLLFAAKYYALAVAFIAMNNSQSIVKQYASRALMRAATWDYILGAFCSFLTLTEMELCIHQVHARNPGDLANDTEVQSFVFHLLMLKAISERANPDFDVVVTDRIGQWLPKDWVESMLPEVRERLADLDDEQLNEHLSQEILGLPFNDSEVQRRVTWSSLGIRWWAEWKNDYVTTKEAEQFLAILQICLVELASYDLCLLKTNVRISINVTHSSEIGLQPIPSNSGRSWKISLPISGHHAPNDLGKTHAEALFAITQILFDVSLLPDKKYGAAMKSLFDGGLTDKIFVAHPYEAVYREFVREEDFQKFDRTATENKFSDYPMPSFEHRDLRWNDSLGPTYTCSGAERALRNRYKQIMPSIRYTLPRLLKTETFRGTVQRLRVDGWLDWHILTAVSCATINERLNAQTKENEEAADSRENYMSLLKEKKHWPSVPLEIFDGPILRYCLHTSMLSTLKGLKLECHQLTPDFTGIEEFLRYRYNYWIDDIPHKDPFLTPS